MLVKQPDYNHETLLDGAHGCNGQCIICLLLPFGLASPHQRMKRLEQDKFIIPVPKPESAATHFFGNSLKQIQQQMDNIWHLKNRAI